MTVPPPPPVPDPYPPPNSWEAFLYENALDAYYAELRRLGIVKTVAR